MAKAKMKKKRGGEGSLGKLLRTRVEKLWARFEKTGSLNDYLAYDDALNAARGQGIQVESKAKRRGA